MQILITGATGFVGGHLCRYLLAQHHDCTITGTAFPEQRETLEADPRLRIVGLDLRDRDATAHLVDRTRPDWVVHLAAQSHVPTAYQDPWSTLKNNILGQLNLLEACIATDQRPRVLVIGSGEEYGRARASELPLIEEHPLRPENPYSVSKVAQDVMGYQYFISYDLPVMRARPFNHIGPGQSPRFVLPAFAAQVAEIEAGRREPVLRVGNLTPARDFTDVRDVVPAYDLLLQRGTPGQVYNVASGRPVTMQALVDQLLQRAGIRIEVRRDPERYRPADNPIIFGSAAKLQRDTGWSPKIPLAQTIDDVLEEWRDQVRKESP